MFDKRSHPHRPSTEMKYCSQEGKIKIWKIDYLLCRQNRIKGPIWVIPKPGGFLRYQNSVLLKLIMHAKKEKSVTKLVRTVVTCISQVDQEQMQKQNINSSTHHDKYQSL